MDRRASLSVGRIPERLQRVFSLANLNGMRGKQFDSKMHAMTMIQHQHGITPKAWQQAVRQVYCQSSDIDVMCRGKFS